MVLHDRLLPGTEHRLAHVLAGPIGVVLVTEIPEPRRGHGPLRLAPNGVLHSGDVVLADWLDTRWWEADYLQIILTQELAHWPWNGAVIPVLVAPAPPAAQPPSPCRRSSRALPSVPPPSSSPGSARCRSRCHAWPWRTSPRPLREQCEPAAVDEVRA